MSVRKIYVNPGDCIIVNVIDDTSFGKNEKGWSGSRSRPFSFTMTPERNGVTFNDPNLDIWIDQSCSGRTRRRIN